MVSYNSSDYENPYSDEMAWDLRQFYSRFVSLYMMDYYRVELDDNYPAMLKSILKWHSTIWGKVMKKEIVDSEFSKLLSEIIQASNSYPQVYLKKSNDPKGITLLDEKFLRTKQYLIKLMEDNQMFGAKREFAGL